jgi:hypothetical protein
MDNLIFIELAEAVQPIFVERKGREWISYGEDNLYPNYLLELFNKSGKHGAIVKSKANYITGEGWTGDIASIGAFGQDIDSLTRQCAMDMELFGGFYVEVVWDMMGRVASVRHLDYTKIRSNKENTKYYIKDEWKNNRDKEVEVPGFNPAFKSKRQILYYKEYTPGDGTYAIPSYMGALNYINAEIEVGKHVYNNALVGFTPSKLINFNNGEPSQEEKAMIEKAMKKKFTGSDGWKFILSFNKSLDVAPTILDLGASDLTKEDFGAVDKLISENIFAGHQVTSPMLFGIRVEGQLGGTTEMQDSYEIFKRTYISGKQQQIEKVFNKLASYNGVSCGTIIPLYPLEVAPVAADVVVNQSEQGAANEHLRNLSGKQNINLLRIIRQFDQGKITREIAMTLLRSGFGLTDDEIEQMLPQSVAMSSVNWWDEEEKSVQFFSEYGQPRADHFIARSTPFKFTSDADMIRFEMAEKALTASEANILELIKKDPRITPEVLAETLNMDIADVNAMLDELEGAGKLAKRTVKIGRDELIERNIPKAVRPQISEAKPVTREISIKYGYEAKPGLAPIIPTTRPFCRKLIQLDRLYTRKEIEAMSIRLGYNVFERKGGWWGQGAGEAASPECRHRWMAYTIVKTK